MKKLMILSGALVCAHLAFCQAAAPAQAGADSVQATAANPAVQQQLDQPDGVAITIKQDGSFQIFSRGTGDYQFNNPKAKRVASATATQRAKANLAKFLKEKVSSKEGMDSITKNSLSMSGDGQVQTQQANMESVEVATESIRNEAEAILTGVITLKEQNIPSGMAGSIQVTVGISSKTLKAAQRLGQGISDSLKDRGPANGGGKDSVAAPAPAPATANDPWKRESQTDF